MIKTLIPVHILGEMNFTLGSSSIATQILATLAVHSSADSWYQ